MTKQQENEQVPGMREQRFGIEIELTGLTRRAAADIIGDYMGTTPVYIGGFYYVYEIPDREGRQWRVVLDNSIKVECKSGIANDEYKVEVVSPICRYPDIPDIQEIVRQLRHGGAIANKSCGIHIHVDATPHNARTLRNITNIMASKEDLIYKALQVEVARKHQYCRPVDETFLDEMNRKKPRNMDEVSLIWYGGRSRRSKHYDKTRYHCLNLHSVFQKGTIEFRLFNSTTHAGKVKAYIHLCLAISYQALIQKCASRRKTTSTNEKYTFRTWLLRLGLIGEEFANTRKHLLEHLDGCIAWKDPAQAERQKERLRARREMEENANQEGKENLEGRDVSNSMTKTGMEEKMEEGKLYVAYGSNLSLTQMRRRCPTARVVGLAELMDYELLFRGRRENAFATIEPKQGSCVPVMIWKIQGDDELALDRYEGYPHLYEKKQVEVSMGREQMEAMVYVMTPGQSFGRPSSRYLNIIREGYRNAGFAPVVLEAAVNDSVRLAMQEDGQQDGMTGMDSLR